MNKINRVIIKTVAVIVATLGVLNLIDAIYASSYVNAENLTMSATINPSSTFSLSSTTVSLDITPSASGTFSSASTTATIYTNTSNNCYISMYAPTTSLTSASTDTPIATLSSAVAESSFTNDRWGYRIGTSGNYSPIPSSSTNVITNKAQTSSGTAYTVNFAAKLTAATKPGTYSTTLVFASTCSST